jgi:uncharacterized protein
VQLGVAELIRMRCALALCAAMLVGLALFFAPAVALAQTFPALTGRVVDAANILKPEDRAAIDAKLKAHEDKTTDQVVVAAVPSLEGYEIEDYANRLFRQWKLGQAKTNSGALLLIAPKERKVRIEVGYGLEGALTDALSRVIIATAIAPQFQKGDYAAGINAGVDGILSILAGDAEEWQRRAQVRSDDKSVPITLMHLIVMAIVIFFILRSMRNSMGAQRHRTRSGRWITTGSVLGGGSSWGGGGGGSFGGGGGGFSGGGGSSGGGGASGSW